MRDQIATKITSKRHHRLFTKICTPADNPLYIRYTCMHIQGACILKMHAYSVCLQLSSPVKLDPRPEYHRASLRWTDSDHLPNAVSTGSQCSSRLLSMKTANALLVLPPRSEDTTMLEAGTIITAMLIGHGF